MVTEIETIHVYPVDADSKHITDGRFCWCQPSIEDVLPNGRIVIHRRSVDSPHIETDETPDA